MSSSGGSIIGPRSRVLRGGFRVGFGADFLFATVFPPGLFLRGLPFDIVGFLVPSVLCVSFLVALFFVFFFLVTFLAVFLTRFGVADFFVARFLATDI